MLFLIDDRPRQPPPPPRRTVEPDWVLVGWILATLALFVAASSAGGLPGFLLICASVYSGCRTVMRVLGYWGGLTEWHQ